MQDKARKIDQHRLKTVL